MLNLSSATLLSRKTKEEDSIFLQLRRRRLSRIYDLFDKKKEKEKKKWPKSLKYDPHNAHSFSE